jgi:DNA-directed RNA polymerase sigma subunit (sigma70/sigma32)
MGRYLRKNRHMVHVPFGLQYETEKIMKEKIFSDIVYDDYTTRVSWVLSRRGDEVEFQPWHQDSINPYDEIDCKIDTMARVDKIRRGLTKREQKILNMKYGLCGYRPHTLAEMARKMHLTAEGVRIRILKIVNKIKNNLGIINDT